MKNLALFLAVCASTALLSSCFFSPCSGCGKKHDDRPAPVRSVR